MSAHVPSLPLEIDPLIAEAKQRARRRRLIAVSVLLLAAGAAAGGVLAFGAGGSRGAVPWLPTKPQLGPASPPLAPACSASQLHGKLFLQGGGFGSLVGALMVENRGRASCALVGMPKLSFAGATSKWRLTRGPEENGYDPLTPPPRSLRALAPGRWAATNLTWSNWCGRGSLPARARPGQLPRAIVLGAPGGGTIALDRTPFFREIGCGNRDGSVLAASRFSPIVPQGPPSSALPLNARIVSEHLWALKGESVAPSYVARPGTWLSYTVVLTNRSRESFRFGRTCPAYTEGIGGEEDQAYVLNCHAIGSIGARQSVRLAMRIRVPSRQSLSAPLGWTLAPHSWNAPQASTVVDVR